MKKATLFKTDGTKRTVLPKNGESFTLSELQSFVDGYIELIDLRDGSSLIVNEGGRTYGMPVNEAASNLLQSKFLDSQTVALVGDVLYCPNEMLARQEKD